MTKGKIFRIVAIVLMAVLLIIYVGIKLPFVQNKLNHKNQQVIDKAASDANSGCPRMTDELTRLDSVTSMDGLVFAYHYSIVKANVQHADTVYIRSVMTPKIISDLKGNDRMQSYNELGCTFLVNYTDSNGRHMLSIVIPPQAYKK